MRKSIILLVAFLAIAEAIKLGDLGKESKMFVDLSSAESSNSKASKNIFERMVDGFVDLGQKIQGHFDDFINKGVDIINNGIDKGLNIMAKKGKKEERKEKHELRN